MLLSAAQRFRISPASTGADKRMCNITSERHNWAFVGEIEKLKQASCKDNVVGYVGFSEFPFEQTCF